MPLPDLYFYSIFDRMKRVEEPAPLIEPQAHLNFKCPFSGEKVFWASHSVCNPASIVKDGKLYLIVRCGDDAETPFGGRSRLGLLESDDGIHFRWYPEPILHADRDEWESLESFSGLQDPRIIELENGTYLLNYGVWDGDTCLLMIATSTDLINWEKRGPAFGEAFGGRYSRYWSKAGAVVSEWKEDRFVAKRIDGQYWMYWGEDRCYLASSGDGLKWTPLTTDFDQRKRVWIDDNKIWHDAHEGGQQHLLPIMMPRQKSWDGHLVEPGPQAIWEPAGILLVYNGNQPPASPGDPAQIYQAGRVVLDPGDPAQVIHRDTQPFLSPEKPWEKTGVVDYVTFATGLSLFNDRAWLYYGAADKAIHALAADF